MPARPTERRYLRQDHPARRQRGKIECHLINGAPQLIIPFMDTIVTLDSGGRVVIPKSLRDELRLVPGDPLTLASDGERITLRPVRSSSPLRKERGIWVFHSSRRLSAEDTERALETLRRERDRATHGS
jgi:AbrB family looped-hinge helix DNA binding protein